MQLISDISNSWRQSLGILSGHERLSVLSPYSGELLTDLPVASEIYIDQCITSGVSYVSDLGTAERVDILRNSAMQVERMKSDLARLISYELGVSLNDSAYECMRTANTLNAAAAFLLTYQDTIFRGGVSPGGKDSTRVFTEQVPAGLILAITPFNHPLNLVAHKVAPAIAMNNRIILKPSEKVPLSAIALAEILYSCGLPREMLRIVIATGSGLGNSLVSRPEFDVISFTGGGGAGSFIRSVSKASRLALELGGNDPLIICNDIGGRQLAEAAKIAVIGATANSGQRCTAVKRVICQNSVADDLILAMKSYVSQIKYGDPFNIDNQLGTVVDQQSADEIRARVRSAVEDGAHIVWDGEGSGAVVAPTLLDFVDPESDLVMNETFGPIIPVIRAPDDDVATLAIANCTGFRLSSGVCTNSIGRISNYVRNLHANTVNIWDVPGFRTELTPFGGDGLSGNGVKEGISEGFRLYSRTRTYSMPL